MRIFIDGACPGNGTQSAQAGWGIVVFDNKDKFVYQDSGKVAGRQTNNRAELKALLESLKVIKNQMPEKAEILSDSQLLVNGVLGRSKRQANRDIWTEIEELFINLRGDVALSIRHVPREENKSADRLATQAAHSLI